MKRTTAILIASIVSFSIAGCSKKASVGAVADHSPTETPAPAPMPAPTSASQPAAPLQSVPAWTVQLVSTCTTGTADQCVGSYGFSASADGKFQVGPGPQGQLVTGNLTPDELKSLHDNVELGNAAGATASDASANEHLLDVSHAEACQDIDRSYADGNDTVTLSSPGNAPKNVLRTTDTGVCFDTETADQAEALHKTIRQLAVKYYPQPFPDVCADAAAQVVSLYPSVQNCTTDSDCAYVDASFNIVPPGASQYVAVDDCTMVAPLVVGNISAVVNNQAKLQTALDHAQSSDVCGDRFQRSDCTGWSGFQSNVGAPVCQQNVCKVSPASHN